MVNSDTKLKYRRSEYWRLGVSPGEMHRAGPVALDDAERDRPRQADHHIGGERARNNLRGHVRASHHRTKQEVGRVGEENRPGAVCRPRAERPPPTAPHRWREPRSQPGQRQSDGAAADRWPQPPPESGSSDRPESEHEAHTHASHHLGQRHEHEDRDEHAEHRWKRRTAQHGRSGASKSQAGASAVFWRYLRILPRYRSG